jgi:hypothetical protein
MSLYSLSFFAIAPFGSLAIGAIAQNFLPLNITIALSAALTFVFCLVIYLRDPSVSKLE